MAEILRATEVGERFRNVLRLLKPEINAGTQAMLYDIVVRPAEVGAESVYTDLEVIQLLQRIDNLSGNDLDEEAKNYGLSRSPGQRASGGSFVMFRNSPPVADIPIGADTRISSSSDDSDDLEAPVEFKLVAAVTLRLASASSYYVPDRGRYEIPASIEALDYGVNGNVDVGKVSRILDIVAGIDGCYNFSPTTGGVNDDSDETLRNKIKRAILGRILTTKAGIERFSVANSWGYDFGFADCHAITVNDADSERPTGTDAFVISTSTLVAEQIVAYTGGIVDIPLTTLPSVSIVSVVSANIGELTAGVHYEYYRDSTTVYRFSALATDYVRILGGWLIPDTITITYEYSDKIIEAQNTIAIPEFNANADNVLYKKGIQNNNYITAAISFFANTDVEQQKTAVATAVSSFYSAFLLGDPIQESDLIIVMQRGFGDTVISSVDQVIIRGMYALDELGVTKTPTNEQILLLNTEYARLGGIVWA